MLPISLKSLQARGFNTYEDAGIALPERGAVLIVGANGSGKSSIMEALSWGLWGKTLRGAPPYPPDASDPSKKAKRTEVCIELNDGTILKRFAQRGKPKELSFFTDGTEHEAATVRKAQGLLDENIPSFDSWRRCSVFSGQDLSAFSNATDADRKRLIESILNLDRFEAAYKDIREKRAAAERKFNKFVRELSRLEGLTAGLERATETDAIEPIEVGALNKKLEEKKAKLRENDDKIEELDESLSSLRDARRKADYDALQVRDKLELLSDDLCPTCGQDITEELTNKLFQDQRAAQRIADEKRDEYETAKVGVEQERETYQDIADTLGKRIYELRTAIRDAERDNEHAAARASALQDLQDGLDALGRMKAQHEAAHLEYLTLSDAAKVLGTKGVRAHILGSTLEVVSRIATCWLQEFSDGALSVQLRAYKEKSDGSLADSIDVEITGAGGGYGYKACSGGQRRRIDVAVLLGLAQVASSARGHKGGTLWLDEVFNQLDTQGFDAVGGMVEDLAKDRCVAVISHREDIQDVIDFQRIYSVADGEIKRIK